MSSSGWQKEVIRDTFASLEPPDRVQSIFMLFNASFAATCNQMEAICSQPARLQHSGATLLLQSEYQIEIDSRINNKLESKGLLKPILFEFSISIAFASSISSKTLKIESRKGNIQDLLFNRLELQ